MTQPTPQPMTQPLTQSTTPSTTRIQPTEESDALTDDSLVEEISIDGMCGVY